MLLSSQKSQKLAVLESKLDIYEELSKEMLDKLERAVEKISENSNKIAVILERHETRLDEVDRSDKFILKMIEENKETNKKELDLIHQKISKMQERVENNQKFVAIVGAVATTFITIIQLMPHVGVHLTNTKKVAMLPKAEVTSFVNGHN